MKAREPRAEPPEEQGGGDRMFETGFVAPRAVLVRVVSQKPGPNLFVELEGLCETAGIEVVGDLVQVRPTPTPSHYLGRGKTHELAALIGDRGADLVVVDEELSPVQGRNLEKVLDVRVVDRSELILAIFERNARTQQARMQVELARLQYELPRLKRLWTHLHRERGGKGFLAGMGEKQIEVDRRLVRERIQKLKRRLDEIEDRKQREIGSRAREFMVSLVGYTNAGKSTLMNRLTEADLVAENRLFSTLDTRTRRWELGEGRFALLSDTVGFIRRIPHDLVASFHATLAEALGADLLLIVVDVSDPEAFEQLETVRQVLDEIGAAGKESLVVLNKVDRLPDEERLFEFERRCPLAVPVSAVTGEGVESLRQAVVEAIDRFSGELWVAVPHDKAALQSALRRVASVVEARFTGERALFRVRIPPDALAALEAKGLERADVAPD
ncbi:MAG: GTPase HflX [Planctomycetota bacterium]